MKLRIGIYLSCLFVGQGSLAGESDHSGFLDAVQDDFVQQALGGAWETLCLQDPTSGTSRQITYDFFNRTDTALITEFYSDSGCASSPELDYFAGDMRLEGLSVNNAGQYVYRLSLTDKSGATRALEIYRQSQSLVVKQPNGSEQQFFALGQE